jgi:hypothetical protein
MIFNVCHPFHIVVINALNVQISIAASFFCPVCVSLSLSLLLRLSTSLVGRFRTKKKKFDKRKEEKIDGDNERETKYADGGRDTVQRHRPSAEWTVNLVLASNQSTRANVCVCV